LTQKHFLLYYSFLEVGLGGGEFRGTRTVRCFGKLMEMIFLLNLINFDLGIIFRADALKSGQLNDDNS
jgi:hypothetical protein